MIVNKLTFLGGTKENFLSGRENLNEVSNKHKF